MSVFAILVKILFKKKDDKRANFKLYTHFYGTRVV